MLFFSNTNHIYIYERERVEREIKHNFDNFFNMFKWEPHLTSLIAYSFQTKTFEHEKKSKILF